ncbi:MAG: deoxyguanosinetriphosphate triphosphohydrolase [Leptospiraceae bacterium]|nr:deoxyguanosinetriphosphate triphosphohydrolase [Leptospiraceae bacterium]
MGIDIEQSEASRPTAAEEYADSLLAPYAMLNRYHGGRIHGEEPHAYRTAYARDRDRVVHSKAFRRLGYKTQVFINTEGDNYRTRLTHSMEVAQISRSVCQALRLNSEFAETLALAHDLGHTPFGHAGQDALNDLMREKGGFEHNCQSLRIVTTLETRYLQYRGLNLTRASLEGMMKHARVYECDQELQEVCDLRHRRRPCLEAMLVDHCDRIAYLHHDIEDGVDSRILSYEQLFELPAFRAAHERVVAKEHDRFQVARMPLRVRAVVRSMMNACITDLLETTGARLEQAAPHDLGEVRAMSTDEYPVAFSPGMRSNLAEISRFLFARLYRFPRVMQMSRRGARIIEFLFEEFTAHPELMPEHVQARVEAHGLYRVVADYISGMTDRFANREHGFLTGRERE